MDALERNRRGNWSRFAPMMVDSWSRVTTASEFGFETTSLAAYPEREWPEGSLPAPPRPPSGAPGGR